MIRQVTSEAAMQAFGVQLAHALSGGEVIELVGDVGAGKTTLTKGVAYGLGIAETVQSPSFTISRVYDATNGLRLAHYDFYRLQDAGIMADELHEVVQDPTTITIIEWAGIVEGVLPSDHLTVTITSPTETERHIEISAGGKISEKIAEQLA